MSRAKLIQLIHVARREAGLDDETYQAKLAAATGKKTCRDMTLPELETALQAFRDSGFKRKTQRSSSRTRSAIVGKIRAVWGEMHAAGFIQCGSDAALNQYVARQTTRQNGGGGVARADWLTDALATPVLESLKQWHRRELRASLTRFREQLESKGRTAELFDLLGISDPLPHDYAKLKTTFNYLLNWIEGNGK
ncbi:regulatory protein GemA [Salmonella enterica subsp. enterica]|nr:regulatory protein GemA [Salmonella enterica subsp. enterica]EHS8059644.1 regulatory protein GemA [Salmonella enterica subsp. enterica]